MSIEMVEVEAFNSGTMIKVIGVGGGGGNAVEHMINTHVQGVEFICANTDAQALRRSAAHKVIQLGQSGLGAGSRPERGRDAERSRCRAAESDADGDLLRGEKGVFFISEWFAGAIIVPPLRRFGRMKTEMSWMISSVPRFVEPE